MRTIISAWVMVLATLVVVLLLTGCGQTKESVERDGQFAQQCREAGGRVWYNGWNQQLETVIRAIPDKLNGWLPPGEQWFSTRGLTWDQQQELIEEVKHRGYLVQTVYPYDPTMVLAEGRMRKQIEEEQAKRDK